MNRPLATAALFSLLFFGIETQAEADQQRLRIYNWEDYFAPSTLAAFEAETGIKVELDTFESSEVLTSRMLAGQLNYDLIFPSNDSLSSAIPLGLLQPLRRDSLPNWHNLDPQFLSRLNQADPDNRYAVPYLWGTNGIGVNVDRVREIIGDDAPIDSLALIFETEYAEKLAQCGISLLDSPTEILSIALAYYGFDRNSDNETDYQKLEQRLKQIRPYIREFESDPSEYMAALATGKNCVVLGYSGDIISAAETAQASGIDVRYTIPREGSELWIDLVALPVNARNVENAHRFINYLLRPDVIAEITNYLAYPNANLAADGLIDPQIRNNPMIYPGEAERQRLDLQVDRPLTVQRTMTRTWTNFKAGVL